MDKLTNEQLEKYHRHILLDNIKEEGQIKLLNTSILVVGAGGLGSTVLTLLTTTGIGRIGIIDNDIVSLSNLPRQLIYDYKDLNKLKVKAIKAKLRKKNPDVKFKLYPYRLNKDNLSIFKKYDLIIDCSDNFETKFLIDKACEKFKKPYVSAGVSGYQGQVYTYIPKSSKPFSSLFNEIPEDTTKEYVDNGGVFPSTVTLLASIEASEAIKYLLGNEPLSINELFVIDLLKLHCKKIKI